jgi:hypothetical protein
MPANSRLRPSNYRPIAEGVNSLRLVSEETSMLPPPLSPWNRVASEAKPREYITSINRTSPGCVVRTLFDPPKKPREDSYLFVLIADQELAEGREEQARFLIDAAYESFDRRAAG